MCSISGISFGKKVLTEKEVKGKLVLEVGSQNINGTWREFIKAYKPKKYIGVDFQNGRDVDKVVDAAALIKEFGAHSFDVVISTELLEHAQYWREVIHNMKQVLKPGGLIFITTRSIGYGFHGWPFDFWRYEQQDFKTIFSDFKIIRLEKDKARPGIFLKAKKPIKFKEKKLDNYKLYSILTKSRMKEASKLNIIRGRLIYGSRRFLWQILPTFLKKIIAA